MTKEIIKEYNLPIRNIFKEFSSFLINVDLISLSDPAKVSLLESDQSCNAAQ